MQWGISPLSEGTSDDRHEYAPFHIPFKHKCLSVVGSIYSKDKPIASDNYLLILSWDNNGFIWVNGYMMGYGYQNYTSWFAIGY